MCESIDKKQKLCYNSLLIICNFTTRKLIHSGRTFIPSTQRKEVAMEMYTMARAIFAANPGVAAIYLRRTTRRVGGGASEYARGGDVFRRAA